VPGGGPARPLESTRAGDLAPLIDLLDVLAHRLGLGSAGLGTGLVVFVVTCVSSLAIVTVFVVRIPVDYFSAGRRMPARPVGVSLARAILTNLVGVALVLVGIVLSLPGIPGQGIITILVGLMLTDLPGVRRLERALARRRGVRRTLDAIRAKFGREPLKID
jgi:hypothetical protein